jgi:DNA-binding transcriptional LysR family regulator
MEAAFQASPMQRWPKLNWKGGSCSVPHFTFVRDVLSSTDLVAMLPARLVTRMPGLQSIAPQVEIPGYEMVMLWHERSHLDPSHQWVRDVIVSVINPQCRELKSKKVKRPAYLV